VVEVCSEVEEEEPVGLKNKKTLFTVLRSGKIFQNNYQDIITWNTSNCFQRLDFVISQTLGKEH